MNTTTAGFAIDLVIALIFLITAPLVLMALFGPLITKGIQKMQDEGKNGKIHLFKPSRWQIFLKRFSQRKSKCPQCEFMNEPQDEYCKQCGTRLIIK